MTDSIESSPYNETIDKFEFDFKSYPHFDSFADLESRLQNIRNAFEKGENLNHPFYPFIRFQIPKYKRQQGGNNKICKGSRHIMYAARIDAGIYSLCRNLLINKYEELLKKLKIDDCVIAYRKIAIKDNSKNLRNKSNVHFASDAIKEIENRINNFNSCCAITMDIEKFFDSLSHSRIKKEWVRLLELDDRLPENHFSIFKSITQYSYIDTTKIEKCLEIKFRKLYKEKGNKQICSPKEFREHIRNNLEFNSKNKGIPQGSPISDLIANIYMLEFDILMKSLADEKRGYYRRYSDDILFICEVEYQEEITNKIKESIKTINLEINASKTLITKFNKVDNEVKYLSYKGESSSLSGKSFEYLGLSFDGKDKGIRNSTISAFYCKLSKRIEMAVKKTYHKIKNEKKEQPSAFEIYKAINFKRIYDSYAEPQPEEKDIKVFSGINKKQGNFRRYLNLVSEVVGGCSEEPLKIEKSFRMKYINKWTRRRAMKYCERLSKNLVT